VPSPDDVKGLFDTVTAAILANVAEQLASIRRTSGPGAEPEAIALVGGLAASAYVQEALLSRFGGAHRVLVPANPALAVLEGAVHYAYDPRALASRRSRHTSTGSRSRCPRRPGWTRRRGSSATGTRR
jgi:hypothetical protein